jgi:hypothetical protein
MPHEFKPKPRVTAQRLQEFAQDWLRIGLEIRGIGNEVDVHLDVSGSLQRFCDRRLNRATRRVEQTLRGGGLFDRRTQANDGERATPFAAVGLRNSASLGGTRHV